MQIAGFAQERSACTTLRIRQPLEKIKQLQLSGTYVIGLGDPNTEKAIKESDVVILGRAASESAVNMVRTIQGPLGKKVVFDLDDNMFDVSPISPHYSILGVMPVKMGDENTDAGMLWEDGKANFDARRNRGLRLNFIHMIRQADCITVTTEPLKKVYERFNDTVRIVPNAIDFSVWEKPCVKWEKDEVRVLYTGAANHQEDWMFVHPVLSELQKEHKNMTIVLIGADWKNITSDLDYSRIETHPWVDFEAYPHLLKSLCCDIGIAPISKTDFNDCRSNLKWVEYSALKMATVATDWGPYHRDLKDGETALLVRERDEWAKALSTLIESPEIRRKLAMNAFRECREKYNLDYVSDTWMSVFNEIKGVN